MMNLIGNRDMYCSGCCETHNVQIVSVREKMTFKNTNIEYDAEYSYCNRTDVLYADEHQMDKNWSSMWAAYLKKKHPRAFCEQCRDDMDYRVVSEPMTGDIGGKTYEYSGWTGYCTTCGTEIFWPPEMADANLDAFNAAVKREKI